MKFDENLRPMWASHSIEVSVTQPLWCAGKGEIRNVRAVFRFTPAISAAARAVAPATNRSISRYLILTGCSGVFFVEPLLLHFTTVEISCWGKSLRMLRISRELAELSEGMPYTRSTP